MRVVMCIVPACARRRVKQAATLTTYASEGVATCARGTCCHTCVVAELLVRVGADCRRQQTHTSGGQNGHSMRL